MRTMNSMPLVTICIGAYNRKNDIRECVDSTLAQTSPRKELVMVDVLLMVDTP